MPVLTATNIGKSYGARDLFAGITASVPHRARIGLVGPNGVGKTTLLRILLGMDDPSTGSVHTARGTRIGYLPQEAVLEGVQTLWQECQKPFEALIERQHELERLEKKMSDPEQAAEAMETYGRLQQEFDHAGGYTFETRIRQTLTGLGFSREDQKRPLDQLSGGQRTRALLARLLLSEPDLLLLDEPTNHLDISAVEWLEAYLKDWPGAVVIVSHDRYFLDQVTTTIWEMTPAFETYSGNYSAYLQQRAELYRRRLEEYQSQQEFIEKEEDYIRRNIAGQNTRQAQGRRKRLERMLEEALITPPPSEFRRMSLRLEPTGRSGDLVVRCYDLEVGYEDEGHPLFAAPDLVLRRGECAAILGPNGAGKTTFLKTLLDQIPPFSGSVELGASLKIGYFAQAHENLHPELTLMEEINAAAPKMLPAEIRSYLARFLFTGDDVFKYVNTLSGGERSRLALALLALQGANLLLLDEPTNHLDLPSQEILQAILRDFIGTILLVSHDRYLIDALATQIWEVQTEHAKLVVFEGTYSEFKSSRQAALTTNEPVQKSTAENPLAKIPPARNQPALSKGELRKRQQRLHDIEAEITRLESQIELLGRKLENPPAEQSSIQRLIQDYTSLQQLLEEKMEQWGQASKEIEGYLIN
ncbi:MAG: ABC-F family ATP-binding cassette domain-containing protein [Anaerolineaceae bacterium]|nr:ABC-F family ATP-binding cassette domain-containing protein [Anaerolineaceae bacterium]